MRLLMILYKFQSLPVFFSQESDPNYTNRSLESFAGSVESLKAGYEYLLSFIAYTGLEGDNGTLMFSVPILLRKLNLFTC